MRIKEIDAESVVWEEWFPRRVHTLFKVLVTESVNVGVDFKC